jgi:hypothetical protein
VAAVLAVSVVVVIVRRTVALGLLTLSLVPPITGVVAVVVLDIALLVVMVVSVAAVVAQLVQPREVQGSITVRLAAAVQLPPKRIHLVATEEQTLVVAAAADRTIMPITRVVTVDLVLL